MFLLQAFFCPFCEKLRSEKTQLFGKTQIIFAETQIIFPQNSGFRIFTEEMKKKGLKISHKWNEILPHWIKFAFFWKNSSRNWPKLSSKKEKTQVPGGKNSAFRTFQKSGLGGKVDKRKAWVHALFLIRDGSIRDRAEFFWKIKRRQGQSRKY